MQLGHRLDQPNLMGEMQQYAQGSSNNLTGILSFVLENGRRESCTILCRVYNTAVVEEIEHAQNLCPVGI